MPVWELALARLANRMQAMESIRRWLERRSPYQALAIIIAPLAVVEPSKLAALAVAGKGHWMTGTVVMAVAYALSIFVVERLFQLLKPTLLKLPWFAKGWGLFNSVRARAVAWIRHRCT